MSVTVDVDALRRVWHDLGVLLGEIKHDEVEAEAGEDA